MHYLLFTTSTCPKCPAFKAAVEASLSASGRTVSELDPDFQALADEFTVSAVPTLLVFEDKDMNNAVLRTSEVFELYQFAATCS